MSQSVSHDQLRAFVERIERIEEEIKACNDDKKEIYAEAKGNGFDTKAIKIVVKERRADPSELMELEAIVGLYRAALGMSSGGMGDEAYEARAPAHAHTREIIEEFDPETGEIQPATATSGEADGAAVGESPMPDPAGETGDNVGGENVASSDRPAQTSGEVATLASPAPANANRFDARKLRPNCQHPFACASSSGTTHCHGCETVAVQVPHEGFVA